MRVCKGKFLNCKLTAPTDYWCQTKDWILEHTNGIGNDAWYINIIPEAIRNSLLGLNISECGYIHDYMYGVEHREYTKEQHEEYKELADNIFLANMYAVIKDNYDKELKNVKWFKAIQKWFIKKRMLSRREAADGLYYIVVHKGDDSFFANKELYD